MAMTESRLGVRSWLRDESESLGKQIYQLHYHDCIQFEFAVRGANRTLIFQTPRANYLRVVEFEVSNGMFLSFKQLGFISDQFHGD
jgi:hypothetical protein